MEIDCWLFMPTMPFLFLVRTGEASHSLTKINNIVEQDRSAVYS